MSYYKNRTVIRLWKCVVVLLMYCTMYTAVPPFWSTDLRRNILTRPATTVHHWYRYGSSTMVYFSFDFDSKRINFRGFFIQNTKYQCLALNFNDGCKQPNSLLTHSLTLCARSLLVPLLPQPSVNPSAASESLLYKKNTVKIQKILKIKHNKCTNLFIFSHLSIHAKEKNYYVI